MHPARVRQIPSAPKIFMSLNLNLFLMYIVAGHPFVGYSASISLTHHRTRSTEIRFSSTQSFLIPPHSSSTVPCCMCSWGIPFVGILWFPIYAIKLSPLLNPPIHCQVLCHGWLACVSTKFSIKNSIRSTYSGDTSQASVHEDLEVLTSSGGHFTCATLK